MYNIWGWLRSYTVYGEPSAVACTEAGQKTLKTGYWAGGCKSGMHALYVLDASKCTGWQW